MRIAKNLIVGWIFLGFGLLLAMPISQSQAENIAINWMQKIHHHPYRLQKIKQNKHLRAKKYLQTQHYTVVQFEPQGWVIVSLDDVTRPILAYGDSKFATKIPTPLQSILQGYNRYIEQQKKVLKNRANFRWSQTWHELKCSAKELQKYSKQSLASSKDSDAYIVRPLLWLGSTAHTEDQGIVWAQGEYYNSRTPVDGEGYHTWVGCVATAMGQIMRYWKYPEVGTDNHCYTPGKHPEYGEQCADFLGTSYAWEHMPVHLTSNNDSVAQALYHIGVSVDMDYGPEESGSDYGESLKRYFGYKLHSRSSEDTFTHANMHMFLDANIPLLASGGTADNNGNILAHAYIIDGYDSAGYYHVNLGWNGYSNGKYLIDSVSGYHTADFLAVAPKDPSDVVTISDGSFETCIMENLKIQSREDIRAWTLAFSNIGLECDAYAISSINEISYLKDIEFLNMRDNNISGDVNLSENKSLGNVSLNNNHIRSLVLPNFNQIFMLEVEHNDITGVLDLSRESTLGIIYADDNHISELRLAQGGKLSDLWISHNYLTGVLDLSSKAYLTSLKIEDNNLTGLLLSSDASFDIIALSNNPELDLHHIENLKNIRELRAYGTKMLLCTEIERLKTDNNITTIYSDCNHPPVAVDDNSSTHTDTELTLNVRSNDYDEDNDSLIAIMIVEQPHHGTALIRDNRIIYTSSSNYVGKDSLTYKVQDAQGAWSQSATVHITITAEGNGNRGKRGGGAMGYLFPLFALLMFLRREEL